jgi:hypothetical protein
LAGPVTEREVRRAARALLLDQTRRTIDILQDGPRPYDDPRISDDALEAALVRLGALSPEITAGAGSAS